MGLESHVKSVLDESGFNRTMYTIEHEIDSVKLIVRKTESETFKDLEHIRNKIYKVLKESKQFNPKKLGKHRIEFLPMKRLWVRRK